MYVCIYILCVFYVCVCVYMLKVTLIMSDSATLRTVSCQASLAKVFSRHEYWSGLPCPPPGDLLDPGIKPAFLTSPALSTTSDPWEGPQK